MNRCVPAAAIIGVFLCGASFGEDVKAPIQHVIKVSGTGEVRVKPDRATVTFGVRAFAKELADAKKQHDGRMSQLIVVIKELKIAESDFQTSYMSVSPVFEQPKYEERRDKLVGYESTSEMFVIVKDLKILSEVVSRAVAAGVGSIQNVEFGSTESSKHKEESLRQAVAAARRHAEIMAGELGQKVGKAIEIDFQSDRSEVNGLFGGGGSGGGQFSGDDDSKSAYEVFAAGEIVISATVNVAFELE